jgi:hypothetical protein
MCVPAIRSSAGADAPRGARHLAYDEIDHGIITHVVIARPELAPRPR